MRFLDLSYNDIKDGGAQEVEAMLDRGNCAEIRINLRGNNVDPDDRERIRLKYPNVWT